MRRYQGEIRAQSWQKAGVVILTFFVAFVVWPFGPSTAPQSGPSAAPVSAYGQSPTTLEAPHSSAGAPGLEGPTSTPDPSVDATTPLTASMSLTPAATDVGRVVIFSASASGGTGVYTYNWSFGDGASDRTANTFHAYTAPRTYGVVIWVNDSAAASVKRSANLTVNPFPVPTASASPTATDVGSVVGFSGAVTGGTAPMTYAWTFDDESSSSALRPNHTYGRPGKFTVTFTATDGVGVTTSASISIIVNPLLVFTPMASSNRPTVADDVSFNLDLAGGTPPFTYAWDFADGGKSTASNTTHRFHAPGVYNVRVTVTDAAGAAPSRTVTIAVTGLPESTLTTSSAIAISSLTLIASVFGTALVMTIIQRRRQSRLGRWRPK
jgi:PKD repeat protein